MAKGKTKLLIGKSVSDIYDSTCRYCAKKLAQKESLNIHVSNFHEKIKHQCIHCEKKFNQRSSLITHISNIHKNRGHRCSNCQMIFTQRSSLSTHFKNVHEGVKFKCTLCGALKNSQSLLWNHMKSYHESEITKSAEKFEINDAKLDLNPIVKLKNITRMVENIKTKQKQKFFHRMEDVPKQINSEIEEHCDETLLKKIQKGGLESKVSEMDDDPDLETETMIKPSVENKTSCFKEEFNKDFEMPEVEKEPTKNLDLVGLAKNPVVIDDLFDEVANTQHQTKMNEDQNHTKGNLIENIKFLKDIIFEELNEANTEIKVEQNQDIATIKLEQNQDISGFKSIGSNDQEPVPLKFTFHTCVLCLNKYGSPQNIENHLNFFHKITVDFQKKFIETGFFT